MWELTEAFKAIDRLKRYDLSFNKKRMVSLALRGYSSEQIFVFGILALRRH